MKHGHHRDAALKNVEMSIDIFALSGQCMLILNNEMVGVEFGTAPAQRASFLPHRALSARAGAIPRHALLSRQRNDRGLAPASGSPHRRSWRLFWNGTLAAVDAWGVLVSQCWRLESHID